jgi:hypothetical protein
MRASLGITLLISTTVAFSLQSGSTVSGWTTIDAVTTTPPIFDGLDGSIAELYVGRQLLISTNVYNNNAQSQPFVAIIEIRDSSDVTQSLAWQSGVLQANGNTTIGSSWTPGVAGDHTIRSFVISGLENPQILSAVSESQVYVMGGSFSDELAVFTKPNKAVLYNSLLRTNVSDLEEFSINPDISFWSQVDPVQRHIQVYLSAHSASTEIVVDRWVLVTAAKGWNFTYNEEGRHKDLPEGVYPLPEMPMPLGKNPRNFHGFEILPYTQKFDLWGYRWNNNDPFNYTTDYRFSQEITIDYDYAFLSALGKNKLLASQNTMLVINSTSGQRAPFVIDDENSSQIAIHLVNNEYQYGLRRISTALSEDSFSLHTLDSSAEGGGTRNLAALDADCGFLQRAESTPVFSMTLSKHQGPLSEIARELGGVDKLPGLYMLHYTAQTVPCHLENGSRVPAADHNLLAIFEVK